MKIIVTGANGYIGARLCRYLSARSHDIIAVCHPIIPSLDKWSKKFYNIILGDLRDQKIIKKIAGFNADAVIHLVSLDHKDSEQDPSFVSQINVLPTWNLLKECSQVGLQKFIYFSTIHVYGKLEENAIVDENHPINTLNTYGLTHYLSETICEHYNRISNTNVMSVRLSNSYGAPIFHENNCWWLVINDLCKSAFINKNIKLVSDGSPKRDFIHGNDLCHAIEILLAIEEKGTNKNVYNISSGCTYTILELAAKIRTVFENRYGRLIPVSTSVIKEIKDFQLYDNMNRYVIDNSKIRSVGFESTWSLEQGINDLFNYMDKYYGN